MGVSREELDERSAALLLTGLVVAFVVLLVILFYGLTVLHWFGFDTSPVVGAAPSVTPTPSASASGVGSAAASASTSP